MESTVASYFVGVKGGLVMSLIAFSIVFIVIMGLMFMMMGMRHVSEAIDGTKKIKKTVKKSEIKDSSALLAQPTAATADKEELVVVITAAITAMCGKSVRILSFAPIKEPKASAWRIMNRVSNIQNFID